MKRATNAHRLVFILILVALTSLAFAAPPEWAQGEPPPFNEEDCVFENGRTICRTVLHTGVAELLTINSGGRDGLCDDGSLRVVRMETWGVPTTMREVTYVGSSHVEESSIEVTTWVKEDRRVTDCLAQASLF
ncbi:MAG TPA: hypothetical protein VF168_12955 [Trueperaceae bacterium]